MVQVIWLVDKIQINFFQVYKCNIPRESYGGLCAVKIVKIEPQYTRSRKVSLLPLWCFLLRKRQVFSFTVYCCIKKFVYYFKWYLSSNSQIINFFLKNYFFRNSRRWCYSKMKSIFWKESDTTELWPIMKALRKTIISIYLWNWWQG